MKAIGLTLSGGAIRGVIHLGVIKAIEDFGLKPEIVTGTSMGSIVGGLYAAGIGYDDILKTMKMITPEIYDIDWKGISSSLWKKELPTGIIKGDKIEKLVDDISGGIYLKDIKNVRLGIVSTNLNGGENIIFTNYTKFRCTEEMESLHSVKLSTAIRASISLPFIFKPVIIGDYVLVDGGVVNNCPANVAQKLGAKSVIISDIDYGGCKIGNRLDGTTILFATLDVIVKEACDDDQKLNIPKIVINFGDIPSPNIFNFTNDEVDALFKIGYERTMHSLTFMEKELI